MTITIDELLEGGLNPEHVDDIIFVERVLYLLNNAEGKRIAIKASTILSQKDIDQINILDDASVYIIRKWVTSTMVHSMSLFIRGVEYPVPIKLLPTGAGYLARVSTKLLSPTLGVDINSEIEDFIEDYWALYALKN